MCVDCPTEPTILITAVSKSQKARLPRGKDVSRCQDFKDNLIPLASLMYTHRQKVN